MIIKETLWKTLLNFTMMQVHLTSAKFVCKSGLDEAISKWWESNLFIMEWQILCQKYITSKIWFLGKPIKHYGS